MLEGGFAQIDSLMTNADIPSETRHKALIVLIDKLIQDAKDMKLKGIYAHTRDKGTITRAKSLGFHVIPETIIGLSLQETS